VYTSIAVCPFPSLLLLSTSSKQYVFFVFFKVSMSSSK
jgi:hypothetical protein